MVIFIHREDMYITEEEWQRRPETADKPYPKNIAEVIIAKHRHGPIKTVRLRFNDRLARFEALGLKGE